jgi:hypothetical protein
MHEASCCSTCGYQVVDEGGHTLFGEQSCPNCGNYLQLVPLSSGVHHHMCTDTVYDP